MVNDLERIIHEARSLGVKEIHLSPHQGEMICMCYGIFGIDVSDKEFLTYQELTFVNPKSEITSKELKVG